MKPLYGYFKVTGRKEDDSDVALYRSYHYQIQANCHLRTLSQVTSKVCKGELLWCYRLLWDCDNNDICDLFWRSWVWWSSQAIFGDRGIDYKRNKHGFAAMFLPVLLSHFILRRFKWPQRWPMVGDIVSLCPSFPSMQGSGRISCHPRKREEDIRALIYSDWVAADIFPQGAREIYIGTRFNYFGGKVWWPFPTFLVSELGLTGRH